MSDPNTHNEQTVRSFFKAIEDWDEAALAATLIDKAAWQVPASAVPPFAGRHHGAKHIADLMIGAMRPVFVEGSARHDIGLLISSGQHVIAETNLRGEANDGRHYDNHYVFIFELDGGLIAEVREHVDTAYAVQFFSPG